MAIHRRVAMAHLQAGWGLRPLARLVKLLAQRYDPRLLSLYQGLQPTLSPLTDLCQDLSQGSAWLRDITYILEPTATQPHDELIGNLVHLTPFYF